MKPLRSLKIKSIELTFDDGENAGMIDSSLNGAIVFAPTDNTKFGCEATKDLTDLIECIENSRGVLD